MISPFQGISELQKNKLLKNEEILSILKTTNILCILNEGSAKIININYLGEETLVDELYQDSVFGTNISNINNSETHIIAMDSCEVIVIDYNKLIKDDNLNYSYYNVFIYNLLQILSEKIKQYNNRIQIITKKNIRDKLLAFFENEYLKTRSQNIYLNGTLKDLSDYLSINRSAMFRELRNLKDENFIKIDNKKIKLLYVPDIK